MGTWGPKLYQDDIAVDVKQYYTDQLHRNKSSEEITKDLIINNQDLLSDPFDAPVFWYALADTQWNYGRLDNCVKEQALLHLEKGNELIRWETENPQWSKAREKELTELKQKLLSEQPPEKKVSQYKIYHCNWKIGDVYAYQLSSDYAQNNLMKGKYLFFVKVDECLWHPGHIVPVVYFYWITSDTLLTIEDLQKIKYIPQFYTPKAYSNFPKDKKLYLLSLLSTSARVIPKKQLIHIGTLTDVIRINNEEPNPYCVRWKDFEKYIIDNFNTWDKYKT